MPVFIALHLGNSACKARCARFVHNCANCARYPKSDDVKLPAISFFTFQAIFIALLKVVSPLKAHCACFERKCALCSHAIPKATM